MAVDKEKIEYHVRGILEAVGADMDSEGLQKTPERVADMFEEMFEGMNYTNEEIADMFGVTFDEDVGEDTEFDDMVIVKDINIFSHCEHHMALMYDMKVTVAYIPIGKVIGLSKIARIAQMVGKRLQIQERIGRDIADIISMITDSPDVAVIISGKHSCMTARGIKSENSKTVTYTLRGRFKTESELVTRLKQD